MRVGRAPELREQRFIALRMWGWTEYTRVRGDAKVCVGVVARVGMVRGEFEVEGDGGV